VISALYIGASGLGAQQAQIDAIANNISNVNTYAYKSQRVVFEDLFYRHLQVPDATLNGQNVPDMLGEGTGVARTDTVFAAGNLVATGNTYDLAIKGNGFFQVQLPDGSTAYTRLGSLQLNSSGELITPDGYLLSLRFAIPADATNVQVGASGAVTAVIAGSTQPVTLGQIDLANFVNPNGLQPLGSGLYASSDSSGPAYTGIPGQQGLGTLSQTYLESSNVDLTSQLVALELAQQAYQMNSKVVQVSDDILATITNLRKS
jgi:flagellar basal-body rod protein FlgG